MAAALVRHDALVRGAIESHGGHMFKTVGDAFCAAFAGAADALAAALDAQRALAAENWSAFGPDFADLRVRMGIHTGHADARAWQRGEGTAEGPKRGARRGLRLIQKTPELLETWHDIGQIDDEVYERWQRRLAMGAEEFEAHLAELYPGGRKTEPGHWHDERYNNPAQPVLGVSWYEARAYCAWLSAQTGRPYRLPSEVEREAAARGQAGRLYAYGNDFDPLKVNTLESHVRRLSPVGGFVEGDTPEGVSDLAGNTLDWTRSLWGEDEDEVRFGYPYEAADGREEEAMSVGTLLVVRGGSWDGALGDARAAFRSWDDPVNRSRYLGFRVVLASPL